MNCAEGVRTYRHKGGKKSPQNIILKKIYIFFLEQCGTPYQLCYTGATGLFWPIILHVLYGASKSVKSISCSGSDLRLQSPLNIKDGIMWFQKHLKTALLYSLRLTVEKLDGRQVGIFFPISAGETAAACNQVCGLHLVCCLVSPLTCSCWSSIRISGLFFAAETQSAPIKH